MVEDKENKKYHYNIKTMQDDIKRSSSKSSAPTNLPKAPSVEIPKRPEESPAPPTPPPKPPKKSKPKTKKNILPIIIILMILVVGAGAYYWFFYKESSDTTPDTGQLSEPEMPPSLIGAEQIKEIEINKGQESSISEQIKQETQKDQATDSFKRILIKKTSDSRKYFIPFSEFSNALNVDIPNKILNNIEDFGFYIYPQKQGSRTVLVLKTQNNYNPTQDMLSWESSMIEGLGQLFLTETPDHPSSYQFKQGGSDDMVRKYFNFPNADLSIDYAIANNYIIIATSKISMDKAIVWWFRTHY